ncbi:mycofactocin system FadH/OYE family oxidoreductase 1 [Rhodococcus sp. D2-41]|uniref:mycofactocin system FadH/OYE family oxidoreductase 1 n=1 Tax=Speluncibacter jeojiensis TaxID=2710754 RepID=UPI00240EAD0C|nr:mycofactocin system FadH/OYE family oxidoreductase 1 [Rhodococcus sp. D2-41]MDG3011703.1 mycofactocin system FadH/OYE family oxidoreductase 1 [Rhodococcus sp. D2-41]
MLTDPFVVGSRSACSRVVFGPHETNLCTDRALSARSVHYYARRARGGAGIIVTEHASVHESDWPYERAPLASRCADGWAATVEACRPHGTLVLAGLGHTGGQGSSAFHQSALWGPSRVPDPSSRELPMAMEPAEIDAVVDGFAVAARSAVSADVDGVELDAGPTGLLRQFHSGLTNIRADEYGVDRLLLARRVLAAVREVLGPDRILALRLSCDELAPWAGITPEDGTAHAAALAPWLDLLTVVRGGPMSVAAYRPDLHTVEGFNIELCRRIRDAVGGAAAVVLQGSVTEIEMAQRSLDAGVADLVEMTRAQIADPDLVVKSRTGRRPRPCVRCNQTCLVRDPRNPVVTCIGNPGAGYESEEVPPGRSAGPALIVGGGPAGLEAARVLAAAGRSARLVERSPRLGGMVRRLAAARDLSELVGWLEDECRRLGVRIETGTAVTAADLDAAAGDGAAVVVTTGSSPRPLEIPDDGSVRVLGAAEVLGAEDLAGPVLVWDPVGGPVAVAVTEFLHAHGGAVSIATVDQVVGRLLAPTGDFVDANVRLQRAGIDRHQSFVLRELTGGTAVLENRFTGERSAIRCAVLVDCSARLPDETLYLQRPGTVRAGDCVAPRTVAEAIREGRRAALEAAGR